jgi:alkylation response protein AidB-like acyl-CoA dehydrogenase
MDLEYGESSEALRTEVGAFLAANWAPLDSMERRRSDVVAAFRAKAIEAGYLYRSVPRAYGGSGQDPDLIRAQVIREEFGRARAPLEIHGNGTTMVLPTLLAHGSDWQKEYFIPRTVSGEFTWAQGYSEPDSGSDLASLRTRAVLDDDAWVINGRKIWTSLGDHSTHMFLLARTEPDLPRQAGISYLLLELDQPGVTVKPLRQMTGRSEFCEVYFDDARAPKEWLVGVRGGGWEISRTTLVHERATIGGSDFTEQRFAKLLETARRQPRGGRWAVDDPSIREALVRMEAWILAQKFSTLRRFSLALAGEEAGLIGLVQKELTTRISDDMAELAQRIIANALLVQPARSESGKRRGDEKWVDQIMGSLGISIAGGTSNIQLNIIAERGLGLPRS